MYNVNPPGHMPARAPGAVDVNGNTVVPTIQTPVPTQAPIQAPVPIPTQTVDGRVPGIGGMLDQVSEALVKQVSADHGLQVRVGAAAGRALGIVLLEGLAVAWVVKAIWKSLPER